MQREMTYGIENSQANEPLEGIRDPEILKLAEKPEVISFAGGLPAPELFPVREIIEASRLVLENDVARALQQNLDAHHGHAHDDHHHGQ